MKDNLRLKYFDTETVNGSFNLKEEATFFNSKIMDIEDEILISDKSIQYYHLKDVNTENKLGEGYQYSEQNINEEFELLSMNTLKNEYHNIKLLQQNDIDAIYNTKWVLNIDVKNILREYLFARIKEARTFKSMSKFDFVNIDINQSLYNYINLNILDRYYVKEVLLYIDYVDIKTSNSNQNKTLLQYDPQYKGELKDVQYLVKNANVEQNSGSDTLSEVRVNYSQVKSSTDYKFDYYYEILFEKI